jgi:hypothetical protein
MNFVNDYQYFIKIKRLIFDSILNVKTYCNSNKKRCRVVKTSSVLPSKVKKIIKILYIMYKEYHKDSTLFP